MGELWPGFLSLRAAATEPAPARAAAALSLYARVLAAASLPAAAHQLVASLTTEFGYSHAAIGLHENGRTRLLASSHLDAQHAQAELAQLRVGAMDEAIDQGLVLCWPPAGAGDWIRVEHQALQRQVGGSVATLPLGLDGEVFGA
ncbi:MAG: hypothetical protein Q8N44_19365, partial [Rubrivivax sp.]|nr:hypothetical protein [Rubrivivax sp.]